jgi:serine/threonine-protein kinase RsbW
VPHQSFPAYPPSVPDARRYVTESLGQLPPDLGEIAGLLVSELATNAVRYAGGRFEVAVEYLPDAGRLWVGVTDSGPGAPVLRMPPVTAEGGRGLQLVSTLADRWGMRRRRGTPQKTVWFELVATALGAAVPPVAEPAPEPPGRVVEPGTA